MAHATAHARSSAAKWGGEPEEYLDIHQWFDETKAWFPGPAHRALRHHTMGIFEADKLFGEELVLSTGKRVPVQYIGIQHVQEDLGWVPTPQDWLKHLAVPAEMLGRGPAEPARKIIPLSQQARPAMAQIMAECDCPSPTACRAERECLVKTVNVTFID